MSEPTINELAAALASLAAHDPDRASSRNDVGFSQAHTHLGHALLKMPLECWDAQAVQAARGLCWHYRKQLQAEGINLSLSDPGVSLAGFRRGESLQWIDFNPTSGEYSIFTHYDPALVQRIKSLPGRRWDGAAKCWRVPAWARDEVLSFSGSEHMLLTNAAQAAAPAPRPVVRKHEPRQPRPHLIDVAEDEDHLAILFEYDAALVEAAKRLGGRWRNRSWVVPLHPVERIESFADSYGFGLSAEAMQLVDLANYERTRQAIDAD